MRRLVSALIILFALSVATTLARNIEWRINDKPPVSLELAVELAKADLDDDGYYCVSASLAKTFSRGDWELHFGKKDGKEMWVNITSDRKVIKSEHGWPIR